MFVQNFFESPSKHRSPLVLLIWDKVLKLVCGGLSIGLPRQVLVKIITSLLLSVTFKDDQVLREAIKQKKVN